MNLPSKARRIIRRGLIGIDAFYRHALRPLLFLALLATALHGDALSKSNPSDREVGLDQILAGKQFDFGSWLISAWANKLGHELVAPQHGLSDADQIQFMRDYLSKVQRFQQLEGQIVQAFTDPANTNPQTTTAILRQQRDALRAQINARQNLAEAIVQEQVESVLREEGFAVGGQVLPPVRFRFTDLPDVLIISKRDKIERIDQRELTTGLTVDEFDRIERAVDKQFNVSSIVEPIGGLGSYPTMLGETSDLRWTVKVVAHEWTHNYLLASYVGRNYGTDATARIINETTASIVEKEIGKRVLQRFYPDMTSLWFDGQGDKVTKGCCLSLSPCHLVTLSLSAPMLASLSSDWATTGNDFDFNKEMRETRVTADELLAHSKIEKAEAYMEERRKLFVQNGYGLRKLNQAYFAFHGAYNAVKGGAPAAGKDPIGPAVQALRTRSKTVGDFVRAIAQVTNLVDVNSK